MFSMCSPRALHVSHMFSTCSPPVLHASNFSLEVETSAEGDHLTRPLSPFDWLIHEDIDRGLCSLFTVPHLAVNALPRVYSTSDGMSAS